MTINITVIITDIRTFIPIITTFKYFPKINSLSQIQLKSQKLIKSNSLSHLRHRHSKNSICSHKYSVSQGKIVTFTIKIAVKVTFISTDIVTVTVSDIVIVIVTIMFIMKFILKVKNTLPQSKSELLPLIS